MTRKNCGEMRLIRLGRRRWCSSRATIENRFRRPRRLILWNIILTQGAPICRRLGGVGSEMIRIRWKWWSRRQILNLHLIGMQLWNSSIWLMFNHYNMGSSMSWKRGYWLVKTNNNIAKTNFPSDIKKVEPLVNNHWVNSFKVRICSPNLILICNLIMRNSFSLTLRKGW